MTWREVLETPSHYSHNPHKSNCGDIGNCGERTSEKNSRNQPREKHRKNNSSAYSHNSHNPQKLPSGPELEAICRRAVSGFPSITPERLRHFLEVAQNPAWTTEKAARHLARRMQQGLLCFGSEPAPEKRYTREAPTLRRAN